MDILAGPFTAQAVMGCNCTYVYACTQLMPGNLKLSVTHRHDCICIMFLMSQAGHLHSMPTRKSFDQIINRRSPAPQAHDGHIVQVTVVVTSLKFMLISGEKNLCALNVEQFSQQPNLHYPKCTSASQTYSIHTALSAAVTTAHKNFCRANKVDETSFRPELAHLTFMKPTW